MSLKNHLFPLICCVLLVSCAPAPSPRETPTTEAPTTETPAPQTPAPSTPPVVQPQTQQGQVLPITATAKIVSSGKMFDLEVATTPEQEQMGLMYRESLPDNRGMLFVFNPARQVYFWMKNCRMNLDMVFLHQGVVKAIAKNVPPCKSDPCPVYGTPADIDQVIEIRGGLADEIGLKEGEKIIVTPKKN